MDSLTTLVNSWVSLAHGIDWEEPLTLSPCRMSPRRSDPRFGALVAPFTTPRGVTQSISRPPSPLPVAFSKVAIFRPRF